MAIVGEADAIFIYYNSLMFIEESNDMCSLLIIPWLARSSGVSESTDSGDFTGWSTIKLKPAL
jgi:hypothetical protein